MNPDQLLKLAVYFERQAQAVSAQPGDIQTALERANLWNISPTVSPLLDAAGVPDSAKVNIAIGVNPGGHIDYHANLAPQNPHVSQKLSALLKQKLSTPMSQAIKGLTVSNPLTVNWLTF